MAGLLHSRPAISFAIIKIVNYEALANTVTAFHATLLFCVFIGILISARYKRFRPMEALFFLGFIVAWSIYGGCPLTNLEWSLRLHTLNPTNINEVGFIPFYYEKLTGHAVSRYTVALSTYTTAFLFFLVSVEWASPIVNMELFKLRESIKKRRLVRSKKRPSKKR